MGRFFRFFPRFLSYIIARPPPKVPGEQAPKTIKTFTFMRKLLTPRQIARAIDVSESSVKRWCDRGKIRTQYTAGGHRRITLGELVRFLRDNRYELIAPDAVGLPIGLGTTERIIERAAERFLQQLIGGDADACLRMVYDLYLGEHRVSRICDQVLQKSLEELGRLWQIGELGIYQERRGVEICNQVLYELQSLLPSPPEGAPIAIGGTPARDPYRLATRMVELVLRDHQWDARSLGDNLPFATLEDAIKRMGPQLFWLSVSHVESEAEFLSDYAAFISCMPASLPVVLGGRAINESLRHEMKYTVYCETLRDLESFIESPRCVSVAGKAP